jgi:hypothetical protein
VTTRSSRLWAAAETTATTKLVFTCPAGSAAILKSVYGYMSATPGQTIVQVYTAASTAAVYLILDAAAPAVALLRWDGWMVLEPGDYVSIYSSGGTVQTWGSGALLPLGST